MVELLKTQHLCLMLIFGASSINNTMSKINSVPNYSNEAKSFLCTQTIEKFPLWAGAAAGRCFSTNLQFLTYFCEHGPSELCVNCSADPPRETVILSELSNRVKPGPNAHRCRMIGFLHREDAGRTTCHSDTQHGVASLKNTPVARAQTAKEEEFLGMQCSRTIPVTNWRP